MKRSVRILSLLMIAFVVLTACGGEADDSSTSMPTVNTMTGPSAPNTEPSAPTTVPSDPTSEPTVPTTEPTEPSMPEYVTWSEYVPGTIELVPQKSDDFSFERKYRYLFYSYRAKFDSLLSAEQRTDWWEFLEEERKRNNYGEYREEMVLVTMIKRYNIPKEAFQGVVDYYIQLCRELNQDMLQEEYEIPNVDVIYTFDNEIINRFYRYE